MQSRHTLIAAFRLTLLAAGGSLALAACGDSAKDDAAAYNACLTLAKSKLPKAEFVAQDKAKINSLQDGTVAVIIGYTNEGKAANVDCNVQKQQDQSFKVNYSNLP